MNPRITQKCCTMHEQILKLNTENENLQKKNMQLHEQHADFQEQMRELKTSQNDLSLKLLQSEEERDKVHKALFKMQVQEKQQKEERETETFELESKVLVLENELVRVELQRDSDYQELVLANAWLSALEKDYQELSTQHLALKNKEHEPCKPSATEQEMKTVVADQLETKVQEEIEGIKTCYMRRQNKLEEKLISIDKERQEAKEKVKDFQHKMAEQATAVLVSKSQQKEVQAENSKLQLRLKQLSEDYRARLLRCLHDLAKHVDLSAKVEVKKSGKKIDYGKDDADKVRKLLEEMITEIRSTYKAREEQLARAVRSYKKRMHNVVVQHQQLLAAYRLARDQVLTFGPAGSDSGPPEACFILFDGDRQSALARQLMELQRDKAQLEAELAVMRDHFKRHKCQIMDKREGNENTPDKKHQLNLEKQLKDFTIPAYTGRLGEGACKATESSSDSKGDACRDAKNMLTLSSCNKNNT